MGGLVKFLVISVVVVFALGIAGGVYWFLGHAVGWLMDRFGVHQPWWVWSIAWALLTLLLKAAAPSGKSES